MQVNYKYIPLPLLLNKELNSTWLEEDDDIPDFIVKEISKKEYLEKIGYLIEKAHKKLYELTDSFIDKKSSENMPRMLKATIAFANNFDFIDDNLAENYLKMLEYIKENCSAESPSWFIYLLDERIRLSSVLLNNLEALRLERDGEYRYFLNIESLPLAIPSIDVTTIETEYKKGLDRDIAEFYS